MEVKLGKGLLRFLKGDISQQDTAAIVNAANSGLLGGGGVDGAIHRAGGPEIGEQCQAIRASQGGCPPGQAVITGGGRLKASFVIHAVGPVWRGGSYGEDDLLSSAYQASLALVRAKGLPSVAFPSISTGAYRFPLARAAKIAVRTVANFLVADQESPPLEVRFLLFSDRDLAAYEQACQEVLATLGQG